MVATVGGKVDHAVIQASPVPVEHVGSGVTRVGVRLNIPVGVNCTFPFGKSFASALAGVATTDVSMRGVPLPHAPVAMTRDKTTTETSSRTATSRFVHHIKN
jgi:hypothetical protein